MAFFAGAFFAAGRRLAAARTFDFALAAGFFYTAVLVAVVRLLLIILVIWEYAKLLKLIE